MGNARTTVTCLVTFAMVAAALGGCSDAPVDIGEKNVEGSGSTLAEYAGQWDGYTEAFLFDDGSDRVRLTVQSDGSGMIRFGERALYPPATDVAEPYPEHNPVDISASFDPWTGFEYSLHSAKIETKRIRLTASTADVYASYCNLLTPFPSSKMASGYDCLPDHTSGRACGDTCCLYDDDELVLEAYCQLVGLCGGFVCVCTASGCGLRGSRPANVSLDAALEADGDALTGTLSLPTPEGKVTVRMVRL